MLKKEAYNKMICFFFCHLGRVRLAIFWHLGTGSFDNFLPGGTGCFEKREVNVNERC